MVQQVNLYQSIFYKQKTRFSALQVSQLSLALLLVLAVTSGLSFWQKMLLQSEWDELKAQQTQSQQQLQQLQAQMAARQPDAALLKQIDELTQDINTKRQVMGVLSGKTFGNTEGFVAHFTGLARQRIEGMWLTDVAILNGGTSLGMKGNAMKPEYVPQYLQRLTQEPVFSGTEFKTFLLARTEEQPQWINFDLQSIVETKQP